MKTRMRRRCANKYYLPMIEPNFDRQVVLITGAGKGTGRRLAEAFAARGARVALNDISPLNVEQAAAQIVARGGQARVYVEDVAKKVAAQALVRQVEDDFGRIDILVNHACVEPRSPLLDMDEWDWHRVLDVNLTGAFLMTQSVGRVMREQGGGVIVSTITGAIRGSRKGRAAFLASMAGLQAFSRQAARELTPYHIRVYAVRGNTPLERILALCQRQ